MSRYQLRRVGGDPRPSDPLALIPLDQDALKFGRNPDQVQVILHSVFYSNMISREHSEIRRMKNQDGTTSYYLVDRSLNGTYVNERRAQNSVLLHPGDTIKFGHVNGAAIQPGQLAPQPHAEFTFVFEKVPRNAPGQASDHPLSNSEVAMQQQIASNYLQSPQAWTANAAAQSFRPNVYQAAQLQRFQTSNPYGYGAAGAAFNSYQQATNLLASANPAAYAALYHQWPRQQHEAASQVDPTLQLQMQQMQQMQQQQQQQARLAAPWATHASLGQQLGQQHMTAASVASCALTPTTVANPYVSQASGLALPRTISANAAQRYSFDPLEPSAPLQSTVDTIAVLDQLSQGRQPAAVQPQLLPPASSSTTTSNAVTQAQSVIVGDSCKLVDVKKMECDSSVPSPPKTTRPSVVDDKSAVHGKSTRLYPEEEIGLAQDLRELAASAAENSRLIYNDSPEELFGGSTDGKSSSSPVPLTARNKSKSKSPSRSPARSSRERSSSPSPSVASAKRRSAADEAAEMKRRRKSNEVARLLNDLTEGSWMQQAYGRKTGAPRSPRKNRRAEDSDNEEESPVVKREESPPSDAASSSSGATSNDERDKGEKSSPLKKRKGFRSPLHSPSPPPARSRSPTSSPKKRASLASLLSGGSKRSTPTAAAPAKTSKKVAAPSTRSNAKTKAKKTPPAQAKRPTKSTAKKRRKGSDSESDNDDEDDSDSDDDDDDSFVGPSAAVATTNVDEWKYHDPEKLCDARQDCLKPQEDNIDWIQCDDCENWYHVGCVQCDYDDITSNDADFHCGCASSKTDKKKKKKSPATRKSAPRKAKA